MLTCFDELAKHICLSILLTLNKLNKTKCGEEENSINDWNPQFSISKDLHPRAKIPYNLLLRPYPLKMRKQIQLYYMDPN